MASSQVDQKFLGRLARGVEGDNPLLAAMLFKILGLSLNLARQLVAAKKQRRAETAQAPVVLQRVVHILWLAREGLLMLQQYVLPFVGACTELKVLAYKLRASFNHILVLFHNHPPVSSMVTCTPELMAAAANIVARTASTTMTAMATMTTPKTTTTTKTTTQQQQQQHPNHHIMHMLAPPPGFDAHAALLPPSCLVPARDFLPTAHAHFLEAVRLADQLLWGSHSLRLSVRTEYAAFLYDCVHDADASRSLAKQTIADVYAATQGLDDDMFTDSCQLVTVLGRMMKRGLVPPVVTLRPKTVATPLDIHNPI